MKCSRCKTRIVYDTAQGKLICPQCSPVPRPVLPAEVVTAMVVADPEPEVEPVKSGTLATLRRWFIG